MFSDNNRISGRQAFRILTYDLLGAGSLLVPGILANRAGCDGIFSIGLAVVFALFYVKVLSGVLADKKQDTFGTYLERRLGKVAGKTVSILYVGICGISFYKHHFKISSTGGEFSVNSFYSGASRCLRAFWWS